MIRCTPVCGPAPRLNAVSGLPSGWRIAEREHGGLARGRDGTVRSCVEPVLVRRLHRDAALLGAAAAAAAGEQRRRARDERDSVAEMLAVATAACARADADRRRAALPPDAGGARSVRRRCRSTAAPRVHLELFAAGRVVIVPAADRRCAARDLRSAGSPRARCRARALDDRPDRRRRTSSRRATLGDLFAVWGSRSARRGCSASAAAVRVYRERRSARTVDPRRLRLRDGDEIVLEVGPFIPPHRSYRFPPSLSPSAGPGVAFSRTTITTTARDPRGEGRNCDEQLEPDAFTRPAVLRVRERADRDRERQQRRVTSATITSVDEPPPPSERLRLDDRRRRVGRLGAGPVDDGAVGVRLADAERVAPVRRRLRRGTRRPRPRRSARRRRSRSPS